jgi:hypothetical protein
MTASPSRVASSVDADERPIAVLDTQNRRRAAGCHLCLSVPALPNVGLAAPDRPQLAWVYPELYEQPHACDEVVVCESLAAMGDVMESLCATASAVESLSAASSANESLAATPSAGEAMNATPSAQENLTEVITIVAC